jgi:hypothetical protein
MSILCDVVPKTNEQRLEDWLDKDGPFLHFAERWLHRDQPKDDRFITHANYLEVPNACRRQAE